MSRLWPKWNNSCNYSRSICICKTEQKRIQLATCLFSIIILININSILFQHTSLRRCKRASRRNASHTLRVSRWRIRWWFIWWRRSVFMHIVLPVCLYIYLTCQKFYMMQCSNIQRSSCSINITVSRFYYAITCPNSKCKFKSDENVCILIYMQNERSH